VHHAAHQLSAPTAQIPSSLPPIIYATIILALQGSTRTRQLEPVKIAPLTAIAARMEFSALVVTHKAISECLARTAADVYQHPATMNPTQLRRSHALKVAQDASLPKIVLSV